MTLVAVNRDAMRCDAMALTLQRITFLGGHESGYPDSSSFMFATEHKNVIILDFFVSALKNFCYTEYIQLNII